MERKTINTKHKFMCKTLVKLYQEKNYRQRSFVLYYLTIFIVTTIFKKVFKNMNLTFELQSPN